MSSDIAIKVECLGKCYQIYDKPMDRLKQSIRPRLQKLVGSPQQQYCREFWALNNVSFEVKKGETVGIIGRNGSGKSTLLQIICGTLSPNSGSLISHGRIAALLELGSGFNPEFTGRENVYMNAAVLGLSRNEIDGRFNDIASFADIGDFIEQPVKTYSSGMMVRLAFAVIANVDADILVVDEALAVGDVIFTQKCMRFLRRFRKTGTLLFVSHDIGTVNNLCQRAIWLEGGKVQRQGCADDVTKAYMADSARHIYGDSVELQEVGTESEDHGKLNLDIDMSTEISFYDDIVNSDGWKSGFAEILNVTLNAESKVSFCGGETVCLKIVANVYHALQSPIIGFLVKDRLGQPLFGDNTYKYVQPSMAVMPGEVLVAKFVFDLPMLPNGQYSMTAAIADGDPYVHTQHHWLHDAAIINVQSSNLRYGLVGIRFDSVGLTKLNAGGDG